MRRWLSTLVRVGTGAQRVDLILYTGDTSGMYPMTRMERGYFSHTVANVAEGQRYASRSTAARPARPGVAWQPEGVHTPPAVFGQRLLSGLPCIGPAL